MLFADRISYETENGLLNNMNYRSEIRGKVMKTSARMRGIMLGITMSLALLGLFGGSAFGDVIIDNEVPARRSRGRGKSPAGQRPTARIPCGPATGRRTPGA